LSQNPWILSFGISYSDSSIKDSDSYLLSIHGSVERKFFGWFGLKALLAGHSYSRPEKQESKNGTPNTSETFIKDISATEWSISTPIYFYRNMYLAPELGVLNSALRKVTRTYSSLGIGNDTSPVEVKVSQNFSGLYFGYSSFKDGIHPWGWYGEFGYRAHSDSKNFAGANSLLGRFGLLYRF